MHDPLSSCSDRELAKLEEYWALLHEFGGRINLVAKESLRDRDTFFDVHLRHALTLAHRSFPDGCTVVDWGTGGGIPAIPLAIRFPAVSFVAVDAVEKKIMAVRAIARRLELDNLTSWHGRAEEWKGKTDYSVSRATASLKTLWSWHTRSRRDPRAVRTPNDWCQELLCLKGGDLKQEVDELREADSEVGLSLHMLDPVSPALAGKFLVAVQAFRPCT